MSIEVDNCLCMSKNGTNALCLPNTEAPRVQYTDIPVTIRRTVCATDGATMTDVSKSTHKLTSDSLLNSYVSLNYTA